MVQCATDWLSWQAGYTHGAAPQGYSVHRDSRAAFTMATSDKLPEVPWSFLAERVSENKLVNASLKRKTAPAGNLPREQHNRSSPLH
jgi:hypothetical protein